MHAESTGAMWPAIVALFLVFALRSAGTTAWAAGTPGSSDLWVVPLDAGQWKALPDEVRPEELPRPLTILDGPGSIRVPAEGPACSVHENKGAVTFELVGRMPSLRTMQWGAALTQTDLSQYPYFVVRYRARSLARSYAPVGLLSVHGKDATGKPASALLIDVAQVLNDDLWHVVVGKWNASFVAESLRARVSTDDSKAILEIGSLELLREQPRLSIGSALTTQTNRRPALECLDLSAEYNDTCDAAFSRLLAKAGVVVDGGSYFNGHQLSIDDVPFRVPVDGNNIIRPAENAAVNDSPVEFLGVKTTRRLYKPLGRDDVTGIDVGRKVSEVFLLLVSELPRGGPRYNLPRGLRDCDDIGAFAVELQYTVGDSDFAFPYSVADGGFTIRRMAGAYAVAADPKRILRRLVLYNRLFGRTISLAAVTVNTSRNRVLPQLAADPPPIRVPQLPPPRPRQVQVRKEGQLVMLSNSFYDLTIDSSRGFSLAKLVNRYAKAEITLDPTSGLAVLLGDTVLTGRAFQTKSATINAKGASFVLQSTVPEVPLTLTVRMTVDASPRIRTNLSVMNTGAKPLSPDVRWPRLQGARIGSLTDTWMFFPQYATVISNQPGSYLVGNDRSFPLQFLDIYNPRAGLGLAVLTQNLDGVPLDYAIGKDERGVNTFVQSPAEFTALAPGQEMKLTEVCLIPHAGDWHEAMNAYQDWLATWWQPVLAQDKEWFKRLFVMRVHLTKKAYSWAIPLYDPGTRTYKVDEFMKGDTEYLGTEPEIVHLGGWCDYENERGGDFLGGDYLVKDYTGGADNLRAAVRKLQDEHHIPVSLYMIPDRCSKQSEIGKRLGEQIVCRRADGSATDDAFQWYVCPGVKVWQDHYVEAVRRTQRETGVEVLYVDVFGFSRGHRCYAKDHGHAVPLQPNKATRELIRRIRTALPPEVAVWSEFPLDDGSARYIDGNIHYYCLNWHEYFSKTHDRAERAPLFATTSRNAYRFVFPRLRQFVFLCGSQDWSSEYKFPFFNGEPLYDVAWFLQATPHLERMKKGLAIQKRFADCFSSETPVMEVPTEKWEVHANKFPGDGRTVWTLYNTRYTTVRGPMLATDHRPGATYYDAWNDRPLVPKIVQGKAVLSLELDPQSLGCVVQYDQSDRPSGTAR